MTKRFVYVFTFLMLFNSSLAMAWSKTCLHDLSMSQQISVMDDAQEVMPCHQGEQTESKAPHCEGVCMCLLMSVSPTFYLATNNGFDFQPSTQQPFATLNSSFTSVYQTPAEHPPQSNS